VPMDREFPRPPREVLLQQPVVIFVFIIVYWMHHTLLNCSLLWFRHEAQDDKPTIQRAW
jgi:hypothetical protein